MVMESPESLERVTEGLSSAASCCRELAKITDATEWKDLSAQLLLMRKKALAMYKDKPLTESQIQNLLVQMEMAQRNARQLAVC